MITGDSGVGKSEAAIELIMRGHRLVADDAVELRRISGQLIGTAPEVIRCAPMDRIMLETDAPYMAPEPHRGERCDSSFLPLTAARVAQLKGLETGEVLRATLENGKRFFNIL